MKYVKISNIFYWVSSKNNYFMQKVLTELKILTQTLIQYIDDIHSLLFEL